MMTPRISGQAYGPVACRGATSGSISAIALQLLASALESSPTPFDCPSCPELAPFWEHLALGHLDLPSVVFRPGLGLGEPGTPELESLVAQPPAPAGRREAALQACMSSKPVTQAQLELLLSTIRDQSSEIEALRKRVADLESRVLALAVASASEPEDFEVVSTAKASSVPAASEAATSSLTISSSGISEARREIAREVGQWLKRCLIGAPRGPSGREKVSLQSRLYLVCRDRQCSIPPKCFSLGRKRNLSASSARASPRTASSLGSLRKRKLAWPWWRQGLRSRRRSSADGYEWNRIRGTRVPRELWYP